MFRKIALCAMLLLVLTPVAVLAAGGQGQGMGAAGSGQHIQPAGGMPAQEQVQASYGQANGIASRNGEMQMLRNRTCDQTCEQDRAMIRNMTRDQLRTGVNGDTRNRQQVYPTGQIQNRNGALHGYGQTVQTGQAETTGSQSDHAGGSSMAFRRGFGR